MLRFIHFLFSVIFVVLVACFAAVLFFPTKFGVFAERLSYHLDTPVPTDAHLYFAGLVVSLILLFLVDAHTDKKGETTQEKSPENMSELRRQLRILETALGRLDGKSMNAGELAEIQNRIAVGIQKADNFAVFRTKLEGVLTQMEEFRGKIEQVFSGEDSLDDLITEFGDKVEEITNALQNMGEFDNDSFGEKVDKFEKEIEEFGEVLEEIDAARVTISQAAARLNKGLAPSPPLAAAAE